MHSVQCFEQIVVSTAISFSVCAVCYLVCQAVGRQACRFREQLWLSPCSWLIRQVCPAFGLLNESPLCS